MFLSIDFEKRLKKNKCYLERFKSQFKRNKFLLFDIVIKLKLCCELVENEPHSKISIWTSFEVWRDFWDVLWYSSNVILVYLFIHGTRNFWRRKVRWFLQFAHSKENSVGIERGAGRVGELCSRVTTFSGQHNIRRNELGKIIGPYYGLLPGVNDSIKSKRYSNMSVPIPSHKKRSDGQHDRPRRSHRYEFATYGDGFFFFCFSVSRKTSQTFFTTSA